MIERKFFEVRKGRIRLVLRIINLLLNNSFLEIVKKIVPRGPRTRTEVNFICRGLSVFSLLLLQFKLYFDNKFFFRAFFSSGNTS